MQFMEIRLTIAPVRIIHVYSASELRHIRRWLMRYVSAKRLHIY